MTRLVATPEMETETHKAALMEFKKLKQKHPTVASQLGLMSIDGTLEIFS